MIEARSLPLNSQTWPNSREFGGVAELSRVQLPFCFGEQGMSIR